MKNFEFHCIIVSENCVSLQDVAVKVFSKQEYSEDVILSFRQEVFSILLFYSSISFHEFKQSTYSNSLSIKGITHEKVTTSKHTTFYGSCYFSTTPVHCDRVPSTVCSFTL